MINSNTAVSNPKLYLLLQTEISKLVVTQAKKALPKKRKELELEPPVLVPINEDDDLAPPRAKKKKQKIISTGRSRLVGSDKLYCVCKTIYDEAR